ncbi:MAG: hypothetical protein WCT37_04960 [Patescibacteria group bacterium]|jgi:ABC-type arginine transport system permease subunit
MTNWTTLALINVTALIAFIAFWPLRNQARLAKSQKKHFWLANAARLCFLTFAAVVVVDGAILVKYIWLY